MWYVVFRYHVVGTLRDSQAEQPSWAEDIVDVSDRH